MSTLSTSFGSFDYVNGVDSFVVPVSCEGLDIPGSEDEDEG